jgi:DNA-binding HxlR family transcriptional regulator
MRCRNCQPIPEEVRALADLLERRASVSILLAAHEGALRFNEFLQAIRRLPPATLASRLIDLEQAGVLERAVIDTRPPRVEYRLTLRGVRLSNLVAELRGFALPEQPGP